MTCEELILKMGKVRYEFNPPLSIMEIIDFAYHRLPDQDEWEKWWDEKAAHKQAVDNAKNRLIKLKQTKTGINTLIKESNIRIERWMEKKRDAENEATASFYEVMIEDEIAEKENLKKSLTFFGKSFKGTDDLIRAKTRPITDFINFKGGFAKCLWHDEKTGSMKYYANKNHVHCFGGCGKHDVIDIVMALQNVDLKEAVKIILNK